MSNQSKISQSINDAYFTPPDSVTWCHEILRQHNWLTPDTVIREPCVGSGALVANLPNRIIASDLLNHGYPDASLANYLDAPSIPADLILTNPPFGRAGSLAGKILAKATKECNRVAFILPASFQKISLLDRIPTTHHLIFNQSLPNQNFILPDGTTRKVLTVFQLWEQRHAPRPKLGKIAPYRSYTERVSPEEAEFAFRTQGASAGKVLDGLSYNPASTAFLQGSQHRFRAHNWTTLAKMTAGIPAIGLNDVALGLYLEDNGHNIETYLTQGPPSFYLHYND